MKKPFTPHLPAAGVPRLHARAHPLRPSALRRRQAGATLVELMIGMAIGMLVVLAALGSIIFTRTAAGTVSESARLEQQGTIIMSMLGQQIKQGGAINAVPLDNTSGASDISFSAEYVGLLNALPGQVSIRGADGARGAPDSFVISYVATNDGGETRNCIGQNPVVWPVGAGASSVFNAVSVNASGSLVCGQGAYAPAGTANPTQPMIENVRDLQVHYLTRLDTGNIMRQTATELEANPGASADANWAKVNAIEICLHLVGEITSAPPESYTNCHGQQVKVTNANDRRIHRVMRQTFQLRNSGVV